MEITDVAIRKVQNMNKVKAMASVTFDDEFVVHDIRVVEGEKGTFIAMPSRRLPNGSYRDIAHPIKSETRQKIQEAIMNRYQEMDEG